MVRRLLGTYSIFFGLIAIAYLGILSNDFRSLYERLHVATTAILIWFVASLLVKFFMTHNISFQPLNILALASWGTVMLYLFTSNSVNCLYETDKVTLFFLSVWLVGWPLIDFGNILLGTKKRKIVPPKPPQK